MESVVAEGQWRWRGCGAWIGRAWRGRSAALTGGEDKARRLRSRGGSGASEELVGAEGWRARQAELVATEGGVCGRGSRWLQTREGERRALGGCLDRRKKKMTVRGWAKKKWPKGPRKGGSGKVAWPGKRKGQVGKSKEKNGLAQEKNGLSPKENKRPKEKGPIRGKSLKSEREKIQT